MDSLVSNLWKACREKQRVARLTLQLAMISGGLRQVLNDHFDVFLVCIGKNFIQEIALTFFSMFGLSVVYV